jgi:methionyl-tRNA formyltransferase
VSSSSARESPNPEARRVVVFGKGTLAIRIAEWFHESSDWDLVGVVPVVPEPTWTDSLIEWARDRGVSYVESGDYRDTEQLSGGQTIDLGFSVFYDRIFSASFIGECKRLLNLHNSPLPKYRGVSPINWALKNEEDIHGVTIHEISPRVDDGPIVAQVQYSIYPEIDEVVDVYERALEYGWLAFRMTMPLLDRITPRAQDDAVATHYGLTQNDQLGDRRSFTRDASRESA